MKKLFATTRYCIYKSLYLFDTFFQMKTNIFILCYHSFSSSPWKFSIAESEFKKQILFLKKNHYTFLKLSDIEKILYEKKHIPKNSVIITIDDGYEDVLNISSFLHDHGIIPTLFLLSETDRPNRLELANDNAFLTDQQVRKLISLGWEIGSHSATHSNLARLNNEKIIREVIRSKKTLESRYGIQIPYFSYPRGKYTKHVLDAVKKAQYRLAVTMNDSFLTNNTKRYLIPRIGVDATHSFDEFKTIYSPSVILFRQLIKQTIIGNYL